MGEFRIIESAQMKSRGKEFDDLVVKTYMENHSAYKTGSRLGVSNKYVYRILHERGAPVPGWNDDKPHRRSIPADVENLVLEDHANGVTFRDMSEKYGCSDWAIRNLVKRSGSVRRPHGGQSRRFSTEDVDKMLRLYNDGWTQTAIAAKFNSTQITVSRTLRSVGIEYKGKSSGENHGAWKGGKTTRNDGYILVSIPFNHPLSVMRGKTGYVLEHRLVMAKNIGRPLGKYETVHHINGDRTDNRIENLQLRQGRHGKGIIARCRCCGSYDIETSEISE